MNILVVNSTDNDIVGLSTALAALKEDVTWWNPNSKPPFDAIIEKKPDFIIADQNSLSNDFVSAIEHFKTKLIFKSNIIPPQIKEYVYKLDIKPAANIAQYNKGINTHRYFSPLFHYSTNLTKEILDALKLIRKIGLKICGPTRLPIPEYIGGCSLKTAIDLISSCHIYLDFNLSTAFNAGCLRTLVLTNKDNDIFPSYKDNDDLLEKVTLYLNEEKLRKKVAKTIYREIYDGHTYFHRLKDIGDSLDIKKWKEESLDLVKRLRTT